MWKLPGPGIELMSPTLGLIPWTTTEVLDYVIYLDFIYDKTHLSNLRKVKEQIA